MVGQEAFDGISEQCGVVARQGGDQEHDRLAFEFLQSRDVARVALKAHELTKRFVNFNAFVNGRLHALDVQCVQVKTRLHIVFAQAINQIIGRRHPVGQVALRQR